uniref:Protein white n=1 Tax=Lygus hesperus TaxID=30085 RepID=A0A0K8SNK1_LYGHE
MAVSTDESEPLLVTAKSNGSSKNSYKSVSDDGSVSIQMDSRLIQKGLNNGGSDGVKYYGTGGGGGGGGGGYPGGEGLPPGIQAPEKITYTWRDINVHAEDKIGCSGYIKRFFCPKKARYNAPPKHILKGVTGIAKPGELLALMGASGAGKTTLLNALTCKTSSKMELTGHRSINGVPVDENTLTSLSAYVQQEDLFIGTLTVKEHLIFQALVRMDRRIPYINRMQRVEEVMAELTLARCQNTIIGVPGKMKGISGGEMKRLSFASEVLTNPPLMFCDEPTSGLDSFMAQNVVTVLKSLASKGKTVIVTIHQPSSEVYAMFDKICLMAEGKLAFLGTPAQANEFFKVLGAPCPANHNPADYFIQLLAVVPTREEACRNMITMVCESYKSSSHGAKMLHQAEKNTEIQSTGLPSPWFSKRRVSPYKASWWAQFKALIWRSWLSVIKEPNLVKIKMLQTFMVAMLIGILYFGQVIDQDGVMNINGALFVCLSNMTFQNMFAVVHVFCGELPVFLREHLNGMYRTDVYFLTKTMAEVPIFIAVPMIFTTVIYYMVGLNAPFSRFLCALIVMILVSNVAASFGYFISCISSNMSVALSVGPPIVIPFLLFGGFFLNAGSVPAYLTWLSDLSWFKYGNEALLINQWEGVENITCSRANTTCPADGHIILETFNFDENHWYIDLMAPTMLMVGFRFLAFLGLLSRAYLKH